MYKSSEPLWITSPTATTQIRTKEERRRREKGAYPISHAYPILQTISWGKINIVHYRSFAGLKNVTCFCLLCSMHKSSTNTTLLPHMDPVCWTNVDEVRVAVSRWRSTQIVSVGDLVVGLRDVLEKVNQMTRPGEGQQDDMMFDCRSTVLSTQPVLKRK